jgi:hypothetical protein
MKVDITSMFFNSRIEGQTATPAWGTSIGQSKLRACRIDDMKQEVVDMVIGMTYKSVSDLTKLDVAKGSSDREILICSVFDDIYVNGISIKEAQYTLLLVREHSKSHEGRLIISYAPYITFNGISNQICIDRIQDAIGCTHEGCWFVYEISIRNQSELHFKAVVVNADKPMVYSGTTTSKQRSDEWKSLIPDVSFPKTYTTEITDKQIPYLTALRTKPFMLLAGISGTGKSRIVRKLAQATSTQHYANESDRWDDNRPENFELIQVKPNWHNSMDVVGFYSNISKKYEFTPFVEFIVKAWQHKDTPYFLCLDEMNLAPVEEYFAEFLSAIESRSTDSEGNYITDPIIKPFKDFGKNDIGEDIGKNMLKHLFGEADPIDKNPLAVQFYEKGLTLPPNLIVMGTVNMDETTFSFSRKVLDRAMSVEMNEVDYDKFLLGETEAFPLLTDFNALLVNRPQKASEVKDDIDSAKVVEYLKDVNALLEDTPFKLGYRAANEAMLYVAANKELVGEKFSLPTALDELTLMKILSRIEGDDQRLGIDENDPRIAAAHITADTDGDPLNLLTCLRAIVRNHLGNDTQTEKKIASMCRTLDREHFVSYWG